MMIKQLFNSLFLFLIFSLWMATIGHAMERSYSAPNPIIPANLDMGPPLVRAVTLGLQYLRQQEISNEPRFTNRSPQIRGVFLVTNEIGSDENIEKFQSLPPRGTTGIGVSASFNLELFVTRFKQGVTHWVMIDPAPEVQWYWQSVLKAFDKAEDFETAFFQLQISLESNSENFFTPQFLQCNCITTQSQYEDWILHRLREAKRRLIDTMGSMEYSQLKSLVVNHMSFFPTDLANPHSVSQLLAYLRKHDFSIDTIYVSNIFMVLPKKSLGIFRAQVEQLRKLAGDAGPSYLLEALPKNPEIEFARLHSDKSFQKIYPN